LNGAQAPLYEMILDDQDAGFSTTGTWTNAVYDSGLWKAAGPFYHSWAGSLHVRAGADGTARWQLPVLPDDTYTISAWWPAAPEAANWTTQATFQVVAGGIVVASTNLDQTSGGDQWHQVASVSLSATNSTCVNLTAPSGICVADAIWVRSQARYNNGQAVTTVRLQPMDGIILQRDQPLLAPPRFRGVSLLPNSVALMVTNLTPGVTWTLERCPNLAAHAWQPVQFFQTLGFFTNLMDTLPANHSNAFYRIRAN
jgi:hypothetical protein